ncbi:MAG: ATPase [Acetatifactor sp.]
MDIKCNDMKRKKEQISKELDKVYSLEKKFPNGELLCAKNSNHYKWYVKEQEGTFYLPKSKRELAEGLAVKKYYEYKKQELESSLSACDAYLRKMSSLEGKTEQLLYHPEYGRLLEKHFIPKNEELWKWQNDNYERCKKHEEALVIKGTQGKLLRSKSEAIIDMLLYKNKIPFRYEEKLVLEGITMYPDFVIRHPVTGEYFYWEHFGMMDEEDYRNHACNKIKLYCKNGIIPSVNLIMTYETKQYPLGVEKVEWLIQEYFM